MRRCPSVPPWLLGLLAAFAASACKVRDVPDGRLPATIALPETAPAAAAPAVGPTPRAPLPVEPPPGCETLREVAVSDVVRVDGATLLYADGALGLTVVDVSDSLHPRPLASLRFEGTPLALFSREGIAWVVVTGGAASPGTGKGRTVVRAIDVRVPAEPRLIGEIAREGSAHDAKLVGGVLYTMREGGGRTIIESFALRSEALRDVDVVQLPGVPARLAASSAGLAVVSVDDDEHSNVTWIDLPMELPGTLSARETVRIAGAAPTWASGDDRAVAADDGQRVRLVTCATRSCSPEDASTLRVVDFGTQAAGHVGPSLRLTTRGGLPLTRFVNELLFVAESAPERADASVLHVIRTDDSGPRAVGRVALRGLVSALVPRDGAMMTLGTFEMPQSPSTLLVQDIDVRWPTAPRVRSSVSFGSDWTWSVALDDAAAISFDPGSHMMAIPFTAWRQSGRREVHGTQLVDLGAPAAQAAMAVPADAYVERAIFLDGHLLSIGPKGIVGFDYAAARRHDLTDNGELLSRPVEAR